MSIINFIKHKLVNQFWNIGFIEEGVESVISSGKMKIHWMKHDYSDRWFADPFILSVSKSEIVVLVEEYRYSSQKGRLAKLVLDRNTYVMKEMKIILDLSTHLSFPFIYYKGNDILILPENGQSNSSTIYSYDIKTDVLTNVSEVSNLPLTDATILNVGSNDFLFSTLRNAANGPKLQIYRFNKDNLTIDDKPFQEFDFKTNISRNAGSAFCINGLLYRPSQDCVKCYGNGIIIQEVFFDGNTFLFKNIISLHSNNSLYDLGYHTFNTKDDLIVIDGHGRSKYRLINYIIDLFKGF